MNPYAYPHRRYNPLTGEWILVSPHRTNRPWLGQMNASHASMRGLFEISTPEIETLVEIQLANSGCLGVRMTGAGFGGRTVALVQSDAVSSLEAAIQAGYPARTGKAPQVYVCDATDGAGLVQGWLSDLKIQFIGREDRSLSGLFLHSSVWC